MAIGAATILGSFAARLGIDTNEYAQGVLQAQAITATFGQSFATFITNPLLGSIDVFKKVAAGAVSMATEVLGDAEAIQRLSQQTGASIELLQALETRMNVAGFSGEQAGKGLLVLAKNMEEARQNGGPLKDMFERLGVSLEPGGDIDLGLAQLLDGLRDIPNEGTRSAIAMRLLGEEAGPRMVNAVGGGSEALRQMIDEGRKLGQVFGDETVNTLADFNTTVGYGALAIEGLKRQLVGEFIAGFAEQFDTGTGSIIRFSGDIQGKLIPVARQLGEQLGGVVGNLDQVLERLEKILAKAEEIQSRGLLGNLYDATAGEFNPTRGSTPFEPGTWDDLAYLRSDPGNSR
jgi:hypothetical protein